MGYVSYDCDRVASPLTFSSSSTVQMCFPAKQQHSKRAHPTTPKFAVLPLTPSIPSALSLHSIIDWNVTRCGVAPPVSLELRPSFGRTVLRSSSLARAVAPGTFMRRSSVGVADPNGRPPAPPLCSELSLPMLCTLRERLCGRTTAYPLPPADVPTIENLISSHTSAVEGSPTVTPSGVPFSRPRCFEPDAFEPPVAGWFGLVREKKLLIRSNGCSRIRCSWSCFSRKLFCTSLRFFHSVTSCSTSWIENTLFLKSDMISSSSSSTVRWLVPVPESPVSRRLGKPAVVCPATSAMSEGVRPLMFRISHAISPPGDSISCMQSRSRPHLAAKCSSVGYSSGSTGDKKKIVRA
uniref:Uncharacterized protein n=1 Tax=Anopheles farauti TaxID=69004 RepID=A0A182QCZ5_9DIPT